MKNNNDIQLRIDPSDYYSNLTRMPNSNISGFNPLTSTLPKDTFGDLPDSFFSDAIKGTIQTVLNSYTGFFDLFSESIQNALDATEKKCRANKTDYEPSIWIEINMEESSLRVIDNGCGMNMVEFLLCFRPNMTFKKGQGLRGNKGVGATFLAYGYNYVELHTKINKDVYAGIFRGGRNWVEDSKGMKEPEFEEVEFNVPELESEASGTCIKIMLQKESKTEKPKDFSWYGANTAFQWFTMLRIATPLGSISLENPTHILPTVHLSVIDKNGNRTVNPPEKNVQYYYPHDIPSIQKKTQSLNDLKIEVDNIEGSLDVKKKRLKSEFKDLKAIYEIWGHEKVLDKESILKLSFSDEELELVRKKEICVYGCMLNSPKLFEAINKEIGINNRKIMHGGIQLATDGMPQGELITIPLTRYIGYQRQTLIIVHFKNGDPDMGRKTFQPELKALAEKIAVRATNVFISYIDYLRPDEGEDRSIFGDDEQWNWMQSIIKWRDKNQLHYGSIHPNFTYLCMPKEEQDVIAIYHQLVGAGIIKGMYFYRTAYNDRYDGLYEYRYSDKGFIYNSENLLGVREEMPIPANSKPLVLEYKLDFESIIHDLDKESKQYEHLDLVICWRASGQYNDDFLLKSLLIGEEGNSRKNFGATHIAFLSAQYSSKKVEVIILEELLNYLIDPESEVLNQKRKYDS